MSSASQPPGGELSVRTTRPAEKDADQAGIDTLRTEAFALPTGEPTPSLKIVLPTGDEYLKQLTKPQVRLGKGPHNDIVISDPSVSSAHALIERGDSGYTISDLGSRNGTFVNQERVTQPRPLRRGDRINLGRSRLIFQPGSAGDTVALPTIDFEPPTLVGVMPDGSRIERAIDRSEISLGKAPHNHIVVSDPTVSSAHAIILSKDGEYAIVDLGSRNGTYIDGERLGSEPRRLKHGDTIKLGATVLTFRNPSRAAETTSALPSDLVNQVSKRPEGIVEPAAAVARSGIAVGQPGDAERQVPAIDPPGVAPVPDGEVEATAVRSEEKDKPKKSEKDKKKKKKKEKDERLRAAYIGALGRVVAAVLSVVLTVGIAFYIREGGLSGKTSVETSKKGRAKLKFGDLTSSMPIIGGTFEASGAVQVPGTNGVLFVDDNRSSQVLWMELDDSGRQVGAARPVELGTSVEDPEGITYGGSYFYIAGSQSNPKASEGNALVRFSFDSTTLTVKGKAETIPDFRGLLVAQVAELKSLSQDEKDALNIEGITWDPDHERLLLGLRAPIVEGKALVIPLKLREPLGAFDASNLDIGTAVQLPLGGLGVRDIQYDSRLKSFLIIAGKSAHHDKKIFKLWEWDGNPVKAQDASGLREEKALDDKIVPEGLARVVIGDHDYLLVVGDAGSYYKLDYSKVE